MSKWYVCDCWQTEALPPASPSRRRSEWPGSPAAPPASERSEALRPPAVPQIYPSIRCV